MIQVNQLVKQFHHINAVDGISFKVSAGEIVGFLGPNGAGKTTTMRVLSGFIPASSGEATVDGFDVSKHSIEVRRRVGYLPENVPLYLEMRVSEYLKFRAAIKEIPRKERKATMGRSIERCWLGDVQNRVIGELSRGFKQRVGLAEVLLGNPKLLILDEPTVGLDPNQIRQVRKLISELRGDHTVLLSSHILPEVEMLCSRVLIINKGKLVAQGTPAALREKFKKGKYIRVEIKGSDAAEIQKELVALQGVSEVLLEKSTDYATFTIFPNEEFDLRSIIFGLVVAKGWELRELHAQQMSFEEIFVQITNESALDAERMA